MADPIIIGIDSNAAQIAQQVKTFPARVGVAIAKALDLENQLTVGYIDARKLSQRGAMTLGVVTNRLRSSMRATPAIVTGNSVESSIGSNVKYAGVHEFGIDKDVTVRGYTREISGKKGRGIAVQDFQPIFDSRTGKISRYKKAGKRNVTGEAQVKSFQRHMKLPARAYIRTSLEERAPDYKRSISEAIVTAFNLPEAQP